VIKEPLDGDRVFLLRDFLTAEECAAFVAHSEQAGYEEATITTAAGMVMRKDVRDNDRLMVDDPALAAAWWLRAEPFLPGRLRNRPALGFNERFRYYRYDPGQRFAPHYDGPFRRDNGEESLLTFMAYLNDDFSGGETNFYSFDGVLRVRVRPERGAALVFVHKQLHEGAAVEQGRKYVLRTDVMYGLPG
jgi:predicted 2-oxoglutarate/Fe(II)-dependent dioxygenase YbiX